MTKRTYLSLATVVALSTASYAADVTTSGWVSTFTKKGFNDTYKPSTNELPTDSFTGISGALNLTVADSKPASSNTIGLGVAYGDVLYSQRFRGEGRVLPGKGGYYMNSTFVIHNAYVKHESESLSLIVGRHLSRADYFSGYFQGLDATYTVFKDDDSNLKLWWFSTWGRGFAFSQWIYDFYSQPQWGDVNADANLRGRGASADTNQRGIGLHAAKILYKMGGVSIEPGVYFSRYSHTAPVLKVGLEFGDDSFKSITALNVLYAINAGIEGKDKTGITTILKQTFMIDGHSVGGGLYKNIGNANARIGPYGNPVGLDFLTTTAYHNFAYNDITAKDATTFFGTAGTSFGALGVGLLGRYTTSPISDEISVAVNASFKATDNVSLGGKVEYFKDTQKAGSVFGTSTGTTDQPSVTLAKDNVADRSHLTFYATYSF